MTRRLNSNAQVLKEMLGKLAFRAEWECEAVAHYRAERGVSQSALAWVLGFPARTAVRGRVGTLSPTRAVRLR